MIDEARALKLAVDTGVVWLGASRVRKAVAAKRARLVVVASNAPGDVLSGIAGMKVHTFPGTNAELGAACGKPFAVAALAVLEPGESNILSL